MSLNVLLPGRVVVLVSSVAVELSVIFSALLVDDWFRNHHHHHIDTRGIGKKEEEFNLNNSNGTARTTTRTDSNDMRNLEYCKSVSSNLHSNFIREFFE